MWVLFVVCVQTAAAAKRLAKNEVKKAFCGFQSAPQATSVCSVRRCDDESRSQ